MSWERVTFNRETLYEQVWSQPMTKLAKSYGLSNVGLAKICARLRVPRPGRGYWQRLKEGKAVRKPPLPALREGEREEYVMERSSRETVEPGTISEFVVLASREKDPAYRVVVPESLIDPHPLVAKAEKSLRHAGIDQLGLLRPRAEGRLSIRVSRGGLDRALRIMDALVKTLEGRQYTISVSPGEGGDTTAQVLGEAVPFWIEEIVDAVERPWTPKELKEKEKYSWMHTRPEYDHVPSGRLALKIGSAPYTGIRRTVADSEKHRLENSLNKFLQVLILGAERQQLERLKRDRQEREWAEAKRQREEEERRRWEEQKRVERLNQQLDDWSRSRRIREYIAEMREVTLTPKKWNFAGIPLLEWMEWALGYADRIDPVGPMRRERLTQAAQGQMNPSDAGAPGDPSQGE